MSLLEQSKKIFEEVTGYATPNIADLTTLLRQRKANSYYFQDDGKTPNNSFPLIHYRSPIKISSLYDPAAIFEVLFAANGWQNSWRDAIYSFLHFHTHTHEVLGVARGWARVQFGGKKGKKLIIKTGDVVVLPAGTGHQHDYLSSDLLVVGAYPFNGGKYDEPKPGDIPHDVALKNISQVKLPSADPVYGKKGPLMKLWRR